MTMLALLLHLEMARLAGRLAGRLAQGGRCDHRSGRISPHGAAWLTVQAAGRTRLLSQTPRPERLSRRV